MHVTWEILTDYESLKVTQTQQWVSRASRWSSHTANQIAIPATLACTHRPGYPPKGHIR